MLSHISRRLAHLAGRQGSVGGISALHRGCLGAAASKVIDAPSSHQYTAHQLLLQSRSLSVSNSFRKAMFSRGAPRGESKTRKRGGGGEEEDGGELPHSLAFEAGVDPEDGATRVKNILAGIVYVTGKGAPCMANLATVHARLEH